MPFDTRSIFCKDSFTLWLTVLETASIHWSRCKSENALPLLSALYEIAYLLWKTFTLVLIAIGSVPCALSVLFAVLELPLVHYLVESVSNSSEALQSSVDKISLQV